MARHALPVFQFLCRMLGNEEDANDLAQETFVRAYMSIHSFQSRASLNTWLYRIALNTTRNWVRSQSRASSERMAERLAPMAAAVDPGPEEALMVSEQRRLLKHALTALPDHYRDVILLRHYQDMTYDEIAGVLGVPIGTVRSRIAQARQLLMRRLGALGYQSGSGEDIKK